MAPIVDSIAPSDIIIPNQTPGATGTNVASGALIISGAKLYVRGASNWELVTST